MAWVSSGFCHPHVFTDASIQVLFDKSGFFSVRNHWVYDELYSAAMISSGDQDGNGVISPEEYPWFQQAILDPIASHNYFNYVLQGTNFLKALSIKNFKASIQNKRLVLDFDAFFDSPASTDYSMLVIVVADPSNYIQLTSDMEKAEAEAPDEIDVEYFNDGLDGLTLFRAFQSNIQGLYLRYKKK